MSKVTHELVDLLTKGATYIIVVVLAIAGKLGMDLMNKKTISGWYILGFTCLASFISVMAYLFCIYKCFNPVLSALIVGGSAMFSRDIMVLVLMLNWKKVTQLNWVDVFELLVTKKKK